MFCSACGSRAGHKMQLEDSYECLWKQVRILKEITRHQAEDLQDLRRATADEVGPAVGRAPQDVEAARAEVQRLRAELRVWQSTGWTPDLATPMTLETSVEADRRHRMDLEETAWKAERDELSSALKEQRNKAAQILTQLAFSAGHAPTVEDTKHLEDEVQRATELAWRMRREVEQQVETHRARQKVPHEAVTSAKRHDRHDLEEQQLLQKRLEVERELKAAQEAQLESLRDTVTAVRRQVYQATRENTELRQTLASQQEILRQLQSSTMREPVSL